MTTPRIRSLVSLAAALTVTLTLSACAGAPSRLVWDEPMRTDAPPVVIRFDNDARDYVHVYLVGDQRQWLLARVAPGARATLRIPEEALANEGARMRLAVLAGERVTLWAPSEARAAITLAQPAAAFRAQRWTFSQAVAYGQLTALPLRR
ncbi:MAG: hypothetical protein M3Z10_13440 [Gemmatimonadota bacterium]|nr:hypothetical protein [Gemmatimonadota bacterium]